MISLPQGFKIGSNEPIDARFVLTKEQMAGFSEYGLPDYYFAICSDDGNIYLYNKNNTPDATTGRFRILESGKVDDVKINGTSILTSKIANIIIRDNVTSEESNTALSANQGKQLQSQISGLVGGMTFKGTLGTGGTITELPTASQTTLGYTYKVITEGTYAGELAHVGDLFIGADMGTTASPIYKWVRVPSGEIKYVQKITAEGGLTTSDGQPITGDTTDGRIKIDINSDEWKSKLSTMPGDSYTGGNPYNLPYYFYLEKQGDKIVVHAKTVTLDGNNTHSDYHLDVNSVTTTEAGLMSATDKTKLDGIATGAEVNVQSDWTEADTTKDAYIKNKPILATVATSGSYNDLIDKLESKAAAEGGTDLSLVTTGEKFNWNKKVKMPESISGQGVNVPYYFTVSYDENKATVTDYTIDLSSEAQTAKTFSLDIKSADSATAGLMSKADKTKLDGLNKVEAATPAASATPLSGLKIGATEYKISAEPDAYIKSASVAGRVLTLTDKAGATTTFEDKGVLSVTEGTTNGTISVDSTDVAVHGLQSLAYKSSGSVADKTISGVTASYTPAGTIAVNALTQTVTDANLTTSDYTPAGTITGSAISDGSIAVTVKDATAGTAITDLTYEAYTPAGTIDAPAITVTAGTEKTFATGLTGGSVASFTEGAFTPAAIETGFYTAGSNASLSAGTQASLTDAAKAKFAKKALKFTTEGADNETLVLSYVDSTDTDWFADAVTDRGTFTANTLQTLTGGVAPVIDITKFSGGSKAADSFTANTLQSITTDTIHDTPTASLSAAPTFTGTSADVKLTGAKYLKQEIDTATFTGTAATLGFTGTAEADLKVTNVSYDKATANGATFTGTAGSATVSDITVPGQTVSFS